MALLMLIAILLGGRICFELIQDRRTAAPAPVDPEQIAIAAEQARADSLAADSSAQAARKNKERQARKKPAARNYLDEPVR